MLNFLRKLIKPKYEAMNIVEIKADNILANFSYLKNLKPEAEIIPVLKSNAYGHGLKEVCQILNRSQAKIIAVDSYPEAQIAYNYFKGKVLILGEMPLNVYSYCKLKRTEFVVYRQETLKELSHYGKKAKIHLFFNSGMNREGVDDLAEFIDNNFEDLNKVDLVGFCSHLASADELDSTLLKQQEDSFLKALELLKTKGFNPKYIHLGNSAGIFSLNNSVYTAFRSGLAFYGYNPFTEKKIPRLKPALEIKSTILKITNLEAGQSVSYNESYVATKKTKIALIPFGYFEGLDRRLSKQAYFEIINNEKKTFVKLAGNVCMNLSCLDLENNDVQVGASVKIISSNQNELNSLENISHLGGGIYETLIRIQANIRRKIL